jgi:hypothetical protein
VIRDASQDADCVLLNLESGPGRCDEVVERPPLGQGFMPSCV